MPAFCRKRSELFTISLFLGGAVSTVAFRYHADQISSHFDVPILHSFLMELLISAYLLPTLSLYICAYSLNTLLIHQLARTELERLRKWILKLLLDAALSNQD